jgi:hypothetical protein
MMPLLFPFLIILLTNDGLMPLRLMLRVYRLSAWYAHCLHDALTFIIAVRVRLTMLETDRNGRTMTSSGTCLWLMVLNLEMLLRRRIVLRWMWVLESVLMLGRVELLLLLRG